MTNTITRYSKVVFGALLISIPLATDASPLGYSLLLPLLAVPIVLAGLFDLRIFNIVKPYWTSFVIGKSKRTRTYKSSGSPFDFKVPST